ncbi:MAG: hypothetical protein ACLQVX_09520 [Limisphaerales bacterium]
MNLVFSSKAPCGSREAVENLFFLNPRQYRVRDSILGAVEQFGQPRLEEKGDGVSLRIGDTDVQTLFAFDANRPASDPIGVVAFLRDSPARLMIVHLAVDPDYALRGRRGGLGLGLALIEKVKEIASRIVGVQRIVLLYRPEVVMQV